MAAYHGNLGVALQALGQIEEAAASLKRSVDLDPTYLDGHYNLGAALQALGRHEARRRQLPARRQHWRRAT